MALGSRAAIRHPWTRCQASALQSHFKPQVLPALLVIERLRVFGSTGEGRLDEGRLGNLFLHPAGLRSRGRRVRAPDEFERAYALDPNSPEGRSAEEEIVGMGAREAGVIGGQLRKLVTPVRPFLSALLLLAAAPVPAAEPTCIW